MRVVALLLLLGACGGAAPAPAPTAHRPAATASATRSDISVDTLHDELGKGDVSLLVDVRTPREYAGGHIAGAVNIPLDEVPSRLDEMRGHGTVTVVCEVGGRSSVATDTLVGAGIDAVNVEGGTSAWRAAGYPVE